MSLNQVEIERIVDELTDELLGARIQKIQQPETDLLILRLRRPGRSLALLICLAPDRCRLHLTEQCFKSPQDPFAFGMLARKILLGRDIEAIAQRLGDRMVTFFFSAPPDKELGPQLVLELFGRVGNAFLLDEQEKILGVMQPGNVGVRELSAGKIYQPLKPPDGKKEFSARPFEVFPGSYNQRVDAYYADLEKNQGRESLRQKLLKTIQIEDKKLTRYLQNAENERAKFSAHVDLRNWGDWLKAFLSKLPTKSRQVEVSDFEGNRRTIELDQKYTVAENADRFYKKARKYERGLKHLEELDRKNKGRRKQLAGFIDQLQAAKSLDELEALLPELKQAGVQPAVIKAPGKKPERCESAPAGSRKFVSEDGLEILVGRNDRENDEISIRRSRGNDYFFHVRGYPGSHVILRTGSQTVLSQSALLDAAHLALFYSKLRNAGGGEVSYTRCKYVKKPKGYPPGKVQISQEKTVRISMDDQRIKRLFAGD